MKIWKCLCCRIEDGWLGIQDLVYQNENPAMESFNMKVLDNHKHTQRSRNTFDKATVN